MKATYPKLLWYLVEDDGAFPTFLDKDGKETMQFFRRKEDIQKYIEEFKSPYKPQPLVVKQNDAPDTIKTIVMTRIMNKWYCKPIKQLLEEKGQIPQESLITAVLHRLDLAHSLADQHNLAVDICQKISYDVLLECPAATLDLLINPQIGLSEEEEATILAVEQKLQCRVQEWKLSQTN